MIPSLMWPLMVYEIVQSAVETFERKINRFSRRWFGLPQGLTSVALYSRNSKLRLPFRSTVEEFRIGKIRTQWMLNISADPRLREVKPLLRSGKMFNAKEMETCCEVVSSNSSSQNCAYNSGKKKGG